MPPDMQDSPAPAQPPQAPRNGKDDKERTSPLRAAAEGGEAAILRMGALIKGIRHHIAIWRELVKIDRARPKLAPAGRAELAFLPAALEITETPAHPAARVTALTLAAFFTITVGWACIGELDVVATAGGKIIPSERVKVIQPLETSIVRAVLVQEGELVRKDQVLVELEVTGGRADLDRLRMDLYNQQAEAARLEAVLTDRPYAAPADVPADIVQVQESLLSAQRREHKAKLSALEADLARKQAELKTVESELARLRDMAVKVKDEMERRQELADKGYGSQIERLRSEKELADNQGNQAVQRARQVEGRAAIESIRNQLSQAREEFRRDVTAKLSETRAKAASVEQELAKAADRQRVQSLKAPVDGVVQQIEVHTIGGVVTPAQKLMNVVPSGSTLEVEAKILNKDIGWVEVGQTAEIKIDSFPFTKYGTLTGTVTTVSQDAVKDEESPTKDFIYPARLALGSSSITVDNGKRVPLSAGMTVVAEIKTGTRTPMEYILAPLKKYATESGRER